MGMSDVELWLYQKTTRKEIKMSKIEKENREHWERVVNTILMLDKFKEDFNQKMKLKYFYCKWLHEKSHLCPHIPKLDCENCPKKIKWLEIQNEVNQNN